ncbi:MAG TPA: hypothetical protein VMH80_29060 [Bryobacteraceae bacterium]|nr:hypothetical protein [Bryobacteraceae bacterium]
MRKRLIVTLVFGAAGLAVALPIGDRFGLAAWQSLIACSVAGILLGWVVSVFMDIFVTGSAEDSE